MPSVFRQTVFIAFSCLATFSAGQMVNGADPTDRPAAVAFQQVQSILADTCYVCHGPDDDQREADLRLDQIVDITADRGGYAAVVPGKPDESELLRRIQSSDPDELMPPPTSQKKLTDSQIEQLRRWIEQGAPWGKHWAFQPIATGRIPPASGSADSCNPVDRFVHSRLPQHNLSPAERADRATLIRRVFLDLIGLLPTPEEVDAFQRDRRPDAYERVVDRLLANPHYGERWGRHWLDQARYADSDGYSIDNARVMWPYRDWVIHSHNQDMPFDQFSIEQLAGDLLPDPTIDQLVATGFHRNTLVNQEGGSDPEQFRNETVVDRVNTTGAVWLGLTVGCAQCHGHKFDPISQREYYQMFAFFNSTADKNSHAPQIVPIPRHHQPTLDQLKRAIATTKKALPPDDDPASKELRDSLSIALQKLEASKKQFEHRFGSAMVMREMDTPRTTHILIRGDFLRPDEPVQPNVPAVLPPLSADEEQHTRLDLARWLFDVEHPLTARVFVNRVWMRLFGRGLVETENDFGTQGTPPTHPELLDWLSRRVIGDGWSLKKLHRLIVTSSTYCQSSHLDSNTAERDPANKWLARQTRIRVDAEIVRDLGLSASGMLTRVIGGASVYPPQPGGVYAFTQTKKKWATSQGSDRYRRGMYTFFYRSAPNPLLATFDTPNFQTVCTRRVSSNTPLQSLTLANDAAIVELAHGLAVRLLSEDHADDRARITRGFRLCLSRVPNELELARLEAFLKLQTDSFKSDPTAARQVSKLGTATDVDPIQLAAWTALSRVLLNLDEFVSRS